MIKRTKLRWRRRIRQSRQQVGDIGAQADEHLEKHVLKRFNKLPNVRRFVTAWILLILLLLVGIIFQLRSLENAYLALQPVSGGTYNEGMIGVFTNANPLFSASNVDSSVSRLVFAGLFKYDQNNRLIGDLASSWQVDAQGLNYTVHLRPNLKWQDGHVLDASDVVYTYQTIQNPDAQSSLESSWKNIKVSAKNPLTVVFTLPNALSSFPYAMTNGLVPKHLLSGIPMTQLRSVAFNSVSPVGAGPFRWQAIETSGNNPDEQIQRIALKPNAEYHSGKPKLSGFVLSAFHDEKQLIDKLNKHELNGATGLSSVPEGLSKDLNIQTYNIPLTGEVLVFFKTTQEVLKDVKVRDALTRATDTNSIISGLDHPVIPANEPLLKNQLGYDKNIAQHGFDINAAKKLLDEAGWAIGSDGIRFKDGKPLSFKLYSQSNSEYSYVTQALQKQWRTIGVDVQVYLQSDSDLQTTISFHSYDALLYGITMGVDPDVFPYWHSSQADIRSSYRFNFSEYKSKAADKGLEGGRTRADNNNRIVKYKGFLTAWRDDAPAVALYQPRLFYITRGKLFGFDQNRLNVSTDRFNNVENWMIVQAKTVK